MTLATRNPGLVERLEPFLVCYRGHRGHFDLSPLGVTIPEANLVDPMRMESERFLLLLQTLDKLTFGPEGMPMPRWVFYDAAEIPGAIFGFGARPSALPERVREQLGVRDDETGLVPFSMYIAIPVSPPEVWFGHNLASLNPTFPDLGLKGLASITKALGLQVFRCRTQIGATQWDSDALHIHTRFGPLELVTAYTPAHSEAETLTYRFDITEQKIRCALGDPEASLDVPEPTLEITAGDVAAMQALQQRIEDGERFCLTGPPRRSGGERRVPVASLD
ncbi:MAG: hypothetical protein P1V51_12610 [Deltaproteobacteria bacterium]|nr:hypothetical protein [Deltaproteobacteria bacterium]